MMLRKSLVPMFLIALLSVPSIAIAKQSADTENENGALILGETGERYEVVGTGGIRVTGGHHGMFTSNFKSNVIQIDASAIAPQKLAPVNEISDFTAAAGSVYFAVRDVVCTLPPASGLAGQEIVVCNAASGITVTYKTSGDDELVGATSEAPLVNSKPGKVERFITNGSVWFRE